MIFAIIKVTYLDTRFETKINKHKPMQKIRFTKNHEELPSSFHEAIKTLEKDGAEKFTSIPHKFEQNLICVIKNGESSESVYFDDRKEFNQFRNTLLRCPRNQECVAWLHY